MNNKLTNWLRDIKIDIERWNYRHKLKKGTKVDAKRQLEAIARAEEMSKKRKARLWVVKVMPGEYVIRTKADVKAALRKMGLKGRIDLFTVNDVVVHITK